MGFLPLISGSIYYMGEFALMNPDGVGTHSLITWERYSAPEIVLKSESKMDEARRELSRQELARRELDRRQQTPQERLEELRAKKRLSELRARRDAAQGQARTATNPQTGERLTLKDGKWTPLEVQKPRTATNPKTGEQASQQPAQAPSGPWTKYAPQSQEFTKELAILESDRQSKVKSWRYSKKRKEALSTAGVFFGAAVVWVAVVLGLFFSIYWVMLPKAKS